MILLVQTLLNMNRIDLASRVISEMKSKDEDNVLTQLAVCWVDLVRVFVIFPQFCSHGVGWNVHSRGHSELHRAHRQVRSERSSSCWSWIV